MSEYEICANCVMDTIDSKIRFDEKGVCDHCNTFYKEILPNWHTDERGQKALDELTQKIKRAGEGRWRAEVRCQRSEVGRLVNGGTEGRP